MGTPNFDWDLAQNPEYLIGIYNEYKGKGAALFSALQSPIPVPASQFTDVEDLPNNGWDLYYYNRESEIAGGDPLHHQPPRFYKHFFSGLGCDFLGAPRVQKEAGKPGQANPSKVSGSFEKGEEKRARSASPSSADDYSYRPSSQYNPSDSGTDDEEVYNAPTDWKYCPWAHAKTWGKAMFWCSLKKRTIWITNTASPAAGIRKNAWTSMKQGKRPIPALHYLSDVLFLGWKEYLASLIDDEDSEDSGTASPTAPPTGKPLVTPKLIVIDQVLNATSKAIIAGGILKSRNRKWLSKSPIGAKAMFRCFRGIFVHPDDSLFSALLSSPSGTAVTHMLLQHREEFGHLVVKSIRIYNKSEGLSASSSVRQSHIFVAFDIAPADDKAGFT